MLESSFGRIVDPAVTRVHPGADSPPRCAAQCALQALAPVRPLHLDADCPRSCHLHQLWRQALEWAAEQILEGFARVKTRCTMMGRAAMSLDLQASICSVHRSGKGYLSHAGITEMRML
jgi:hypothetical protein